MAGTKQITVDTTFEVTGDLYDDIESLNDTNPTAVESIMTDAIASMYGVDPADITIISISFASISVQFVYTTAAVVQNNAFDLTAKAAVADTTAEAIVQTAIVSAANSSTPLTTNYTANYNTTSIAVQSIPEPTVAVVVVADADGDGVEDSLDAFPNDSSKSENDAYYVYANGGYYYPVYLSSFGLGSNHTHEFDGVTYYMEDSNQNHGVASLPDGHSLSIAPQTIDPNYTGSWDYFDGSTINLPLKYKLSGAGNFTGIDGYEYVWDGVSLVQGVPVYEYQGADAYAPNGTLLEQKLEAEAYDQTDGSITWRIYAVRNDGLGHNKGFYHSYNLDGHTILFSGVNTITLDAVSA